MNSQRSDEYLSDASDASDASEGSGASDDTFRSIVHALKDMRERFELLDSGFDTVAKTVHAMEAPVASVQVATFVQPQVLQTAPFRKERFKLLPAAKKMLQCHSVVTFQELCEHVRNYVFTNKLVVDGRIRLNEEMKSVLGYEGHEADMTFLEVLTYLDALVE